jgi:hypothetical protein
MGLLDESGIGSGDGEVMVNYFSQFTGTFTGQAYRSYT